MDIEFKEGAVCYADGRQWDCDGKHLRSSPIETASLLWALKRDDFQLNTIKQGDYIEASELDIEQKYNDAVEVFGLFGFERDTGYDDNLTIPLYECLKALRSRLIASDCAGVRKLTYKQVMAVGELKRLDIERETLLSYGEYAPNHFLPKAGKYAVSDKEPEKSAPKIAPDLTPDLISNQEVKMQKNKPVVAQVMIDLTERMEIGIKTYGEALRANNGRDALQDAYEEALDLACYLKQAMIEKEIANYEKALKCSGG